MGRALRGVAFGLFVAFMLFTGVGLWATAVNTKIGQVKEPSKPTSFEDYFAFYASGRMVRDGHGSSLYSVDSVRNAETHVLGRTIDAPDNADVLPFFNPPFFAALMAPFAALPLGASVAVWFLLTCVLIAWAGYLLLRFLGLQPAKERALMLAWFITWPSVALVAVQGQLSILPLLAWLGFIVWQTRGKQELSGASLALALIKPQFVVLAVPLLLWQRQWRTLAGFASVAAVMAAVSIAVAGPHVLLDYPRFILQSAKWDHQFSIVPESMFGWSGFYARTFGLGGRLHSALTTGSILGTVVVAFYVFRQGWQPTRPDFVLRAGILLGASMLISLHLFRQDMTLMAMLIVIGAWHQRQITGRWGFWPAIAAVTWTIQYVELNYLFASGVNLLTPTLAVIVLTLLWQLRHFEGRPEPGEPRVEGLIARRLLRMTGDSA